MLHAWTRLRIVSYLYAAAAAERQTAPLRLLVALNQSRTERGNCSFQLIIGCRCACWNAALQNQTKNAPLFRRRFSANRRFYIIARVPGSAHNKIDNYDVQLVWDLVVVHLSHHMCARRFCIMRFVRWRGLFGLIRPGFGFAVCEHSAVLCFKHHYR